MHALVTLTGHVMDSSTDVSNAFRFDLSVCLRQSLILQTIYFANCYISELLVKCTFTDNTKTIPYTSERYIFMAKILAKYTAECTNSASVRQTFFRGMSEVLLGNRSRDG